MHESASQVLSRHSISYKVSNKGGVTWFNMSECPLCGHKGYQCGISENYGADGKLYHGVKCFHITDNGFGTDRPEYEDFLFRLGELDAEGVSAVKNYIPRSKAQLSAAPSGSSKSAHAGRTLESFGLLNPDFHAKLRKRLRDNEQAMAYLTSDQRGLAVDTIKYFGLGLQEPYISHKSNEEKADALVFPMRSGKDGKLYRKYGNYNIPGITVNPTDKNSWMSGEVRTYYASAIGERTVLFVCEGAKDVWRTWQGIQGTKLGGQMLLISSTHGSAFPVEWKHIEFWSPWEKVYLGHDNDEAGEAIVSKLVQFVGRDVYRVEVPKYFGKDWTDFWQSGGDINDFNELLEKAAVHSLPIRSEEDIQNGLGYGRVAYKPININGAFHNGHLYCTVQTLNRNVEVRKNSKGEAKLIDIEHLETVVIRSDRTVHSTVLIPAPPGTPDKFRVRRLTDGTLIDREPSPNKYGTWSWPSIKAYLDGKSKTSSLAEILADVERHLRSSVWLPYDEDYAILTLVVPVTYAQPIFDSVPLIFLNGPKGSGKSQMGRAMARVCANAYICGQSSAASIARFIDASCGFVVLDDLEVIGNKGGEFTELVQALKLSYNKDTAVKLWTDVKTMKTEMLNFYGVKMINNTQGADRILSSRMLRIQTREIPEKRKQEFADLLPTESHKLNELRDKLHTWTFNNVAGIEEAYRRLYPKGSDRSDEITAPLKVMAEMAGDVSLISRLGLALNKQEQRSFDPDDPEEVLREAVKVLIGQGYNLFSITHLVLEMRNLITHNYGKSSHYEIPEWARPEWVGRMIRMLDLIDSDTNTHKRERVWGANLRFYPFRPGYVEEVRSEYAAKGIQLPLEPTNPTDFCQMCESCPYSTLSCEILPRRQNTHKGSGGNAYSESIGH
jgi:hypothetical protein